MGMDVLLILPVALLIIGLALALLGTIQDHRR
jgi:hypothetical protein